MLTVDTWGADHNKVLSGKGVPCPFGLFPPGGSEDLGRGRATPLASPGGMGTFR